jgi:hypothetical protein
LRFFAKCEFILSDFKLKLKLLNKNFSVQLEISL